MSSEKATKLKAEGNSHFVKKKYKLAIGKYTEAIAVDGNDAVLYCNRAACHLALNGYRKARDDAQKATDLDPKYSKAWGRLAAALEGLDLLPQAIEAWNTAFMSVPSANATPAETKQQDQYKTSMQDAMKKLAMKAESENRAGVVVVSSHAAAKDPPWMLALQLAPQLKRDENWGSSAFVIILAADNFLNAYGAMKIGTRIMTPMGEGTIGAAGVIAKMTDAIILDKRCFMMNGPKWWDRYNIQVEAELSIFKASSPEQSVDEIIAEAKEMHAEGGWNHVRPAMEIMLRVLFFDAFLEARLKRKWAESVAIYDKALTILRWGREEWKDVLKEDRGDVFEEPFMRGVRFLRLEAYAEALQNDRRGLFTLEHLLTEAEDLLNEVRSSSPAVDLKTEKPGLYMASSTYPEGQALSMIALYYNVRGKAFFGAERVELFRKSGSYYFAAAEMYPEDDELHLFMLQSALNMLFISGALLKETIPIIERMSRVEPIMMRIWKSSWLGSFGGRDAVTDRFLSFEEKIKKDLAAGTVSLEDRRAPDIDYRTLSRT